jgi:YD repeat-containing protein
VSQIDENTSLPNQIQRTRIKYTVDDEKCKDMVNSYHRLNDVVETKKTLVENGKENCVSTQRTVYNGGRYSLPISDSTSVGNAPLEIRATYTYDGDLNIRSITIDDKETIYIWSYNGQYPIAKIEGLNFGDIRNAMGQIENSQYPKEMPITDRGLRALDEMTHETDTNKINTFITTIRKKVNELGGHVTTYTYKPLVGMLSETLPNGNVIYYEYDAFGRLKNVKDINKKTLKSYEYNYKK